MTMLAPALLTLAQGLSAAAGPDACADGSCGVLALESQGMCPTPAAVTRRLDRLVGGNDLSALRGRIREHDGGARVELIDAAGTVLAFKDLKGVSCDALAGAAAVFFATWVQRTLVPGSPAPPLDLETPREVDGEAPPPPTVDTPAVEEPVLRWEVGAGVAHAATLSLAAGGEVEAALGTDVWALAASVGVNPATPPTLAVGEVSAWRLSGRLGALLRLRWSRLSLGLGTEGVASWMRLRGQKLSITRTTTTFDPGIGVTLKVGYRVEPWVAWAGVVGTRWLRRELVEVVGIPQKAEMPTGEVLLLVGASWPGG